MNIKMLKSALAGLALSVSGLANAGLIYLDMDTAETGANLGTSPLVTSEGTVTFSGDFRANSCSDDEFIAAGASGGCLNGGNGAELIFDFAVSNFEFIYGGNIGNITVTAFNLQNIIVDTFFQADTYTGQPAGPVSLSGNDIYKITWNDTSGSYAVLDNINITTSSIPEPSTLAIFALGMIGLTSRRSKVVNKK